MLSHPVVSPPPPPAPRARARANQTTRTKKKKKKNVATTRARTAKKPASKRVRTLPASNSTSSSPDSTLLIGGLALVVLVLGDTIFLALSKKVLRGV
jgi:hypothetical protein